MGLVLLFVVRLRLGVVIIDVVFEVLVFRQCDDDVNLAAGLTSVM